MQERSVTVAGRTHAIGTPFFVLATQNPIEQDGTFPLPEAQLDRFFFKLLVKMPSHAEFAKILERTGGNAPPQISVVATGEEILQMGRTLREVPIDETVQDYLIQIVRNTHPENEDAPVDVRRLVRHGASPRGAQAMLAASRARALLAGRYHVSREDVAATAIPALRHRIILSFEGEADGVRTDDVIRKVIQHLE
jgi:MoxR-like ATPase